MSNFGPITASSFQRELRRADSRLRRHDAVLETLAKGSQSASNHRLTALEGRLREAMRRINDIQQSASVADGSLKDLSSSSDQLSSTLLTERSHGTRSREALRRAEKEILSRAKREMLDGAVDDLQLWRSHAAVELEELRQAAASAVRRVERVRDEADGACLVAQKAEVRARRLGARALGNRDAALGDPMLAIEGGNGHADADADNSQLSVMGKVRASIAAAERRMIRTLTDRMHDKIDVGFAQRREALSERTLAGEMRALHERQTLSSKLRECQSMVESLSVRIGEEQRRFDRSAERERGTVDATVRKISEAEARVDDVVKRCEGVCAKLRERVARAAQASSELEALAQHHSRNATGESSRLAELEKSHAAAAERRSSVEKSLADVRSLAQKSLLGTNFVERLRERRDDSRVERREAQRAFETAMRGKLSSTELALDNAVTALEQENRGQAVASGIAAEALLQRINDLRQKVTDAHISASAEEAVKEATSTGAGAAIAGLQAALSAHESKAATLSEQIVTFVDRPAAKLEERAETARRELASELSALTAELGVHAQKLAGSQNTLQGHLSVAANAMANARAQQAAREELQGRVERELKSLKT